MQNNLVTQGKFDRTYRAFLEACSTAELFALAVSEGIDMPPDLERVFIIEALLESAEEPELEPDIEWPEPNEPKQAGNDDEELYEAHVAVESVPLPLRYNITFIEVMIRDPLWAFVFWEIRGSERDLYERMNNFSGYYLRLCPYKDASRPPPPAAEGTKKVDESFIIPVEVHDESRYLGLPASWHDDGERGTNLRCTVEIGVLCGKTRTALAVSKPFTPPPLHASPAWADKTAEPYCSPLAALSGLADYDLVYCADHGAPRTRKSKPQEDLK